VWKILPAIPKEKVNKKAYNIAGDHIAQNNIKRKMLPLDKKVPCSITTLAGMQNDNEIMLNAKTTTPDEGLEPSAAKQNNQMKRSNKK
jgi:hypothetical protein